MALAIDHREYIKLVLLTILIFDQFMAEISNFVRMPTWEYGFWAKIGPNMGTTQSRFTGQLLAQKQVSQINQGEPPTP